MLVYVDDLIITGSSPSHIASLTKHLQSSFAVKDLGILSYFLGIEVARCKEGLFLSQHKYTVDLLHRHQMDGAKPLSTPSTSKPGSDSSSVDPTEYCSAIGGLQYMTLTRPDIAFTVNRLAQSMASPTSSDWGAVKRLFRYLKGTLHFGLLLRKSSVLLLRHIRTLILAETHATESPPLHTLSFLAQIRSLGALESKPALLVVSRKQNIGH